MDSKAPLVLEPVGTAGPISAEGGEDGAAAGDPAPLEDARWYSADAAGGRVVYGLEPGALAGHEYVSLDLLVDDDHAAKHAFFLELSEGPDGPTFTFDWGCLVQCQARAHVPLDAVDQDTWLYPREGAWLKPIAGGDRVDLERVSEVAIRVERVPREGTRWCQTPLRVLDEKPEPVTDPVLPEGPLLDELGQSAIHDWAGKSDGHAVVTARLERQRERAASTDPGEAWPDAFSRWGGWTDRQFEATGFFRTHHDGERWWLVDPDGHPFWSAGLDCVMVYPEAAYEDLETALEWLPPDDGVYGDAHAAGEAGPDTTSVNYLAANLIRAFGEDWYEEWAEVALAELRRTGFNTVGNWSDWEVASEAGVPYVRPLRPDAERAGTVYRDFPDVFAAAFETDCERTADQLESTVGDPALVGYFLQNEPNWAFAAESPAAGMLYTTEECATRDRLAEWLADRHGAAGLADAWGLAVDLDDVREGAWPAARTLTDAAVADLEAFSTVMVERLYGTLSAACRAVDPDHLNLGIRYAGVPPGWIVDGLDAVDVFSVNCYENTVAAAFGDVAERLDVPVLIGEWHFGSLEAPLDGLANCVVETEADRGDAFRVYQEAAASRPWCVGTHYFTQYDKSALGRPDGENYNQGFLDTCNRPYEALSAAARESLERLYRVAAGEVEPYDDPTEYREELYL